MNIGITTFGADGGRSGIGRYLLSLLREFPNSTLQAHFDIYAFAEEKRVFANDRLKTTSLSQVGYFRNPISNILWHQTYLPNSCRRRKHDVLFLPAANRRLPLSSPCPTVGTVHDFSSLHVPGKYDRARLTYIRKILPFLIRRLTHVLTVSESSKRDIVEYAGVPADRVTVTPLGVDHDTYYPRDRERARLRIDEKYRVQRPYILYVSRIEHPGKNHVRLIRAFERVKESLKIPHRLVLAGSDWMRADEVHAAAAEASCCDDILFTGFVPDADLPDLYTAADILAFPSLYEGFGLPVLEAMACGTPVACANVSSLPEVAGDAAELFDPYQEESIAGALAGLIEDSDLRQRCSRRGLTRSSQFTWAATAESTLRVIRNAASRQ
jgi:glycosyltransferase involved in cell wall biosynthesis